MTNAATKTNATLTLTASDRADIAADLQDAIMYVGSVLHAYTNDYTGPEMGVQVASVEEARQNLVTAAKHVRNGYEQAGRKDKVRGMRKNTKAAAVEAANILADQIAELETIHSVVARNGFTAEEQAEHDAEMEALFPTKPAPEATPETAEAALDNYFPEGWAKEAIACELENEAAQTKKTTKKTTKKATKKAPTTGVTTIKLECKGYSTERGVTKATYLVTRNADKAQFVVKHVARPDCCITDWTVQSIVGAGMDAYPATETVSFSRRKDALQCVADDSLAGTALGLTAATAPASLLA